MVLYLGPVFLIIISQTSVSFSNFISYDLVCLFQAMGIEQHIDQGVITLYTL